MKLFGIRESLKQAWSLFTKNWKFLLPFTLAAGIVAYALTAMYEGALNRSVILGIIAYIIYMVGMFAISIAYLRVGFATIKGDTLHWNLVKSTPDEWLRFLKVSIWKLLYTLKYVLMSLIPGVIILILGRIIESETLFLVGSIILGVSVLISLIYTSIRYTFAMYTMVDHPEITSTRAVVQRSAKLVSGNYGRMILLSLTYILVILLGIICLVVGVLPAAIVVSLATTLVYRKLDTHHAHQVHQTPAQEA